MAKYGRFDPRNKRRGANQEKSSIDSLRRNLKTQYEDARRNTKVNVRDYDIDYEDDE